MNVLLVMKDTVCLKTAVSRRILALLDLSNIMETVWLLAPLDIGTAMDSALDNVRMATFSGTMVAMRLAQQAFTLNLLVLLSALLEQSKMDTFVKLLLLLVELGNFITQ